MTYSDAQTVIVKFFEFYESVLKEKFSDLPITNHNLEVKIVGLRETEDFFTFGLITPWMLNTIAVPKREKIKAPETKNMRLDENEQLGKFYVSNVFSPMNKFKEMTGAIKVAEIHAKNLFNELQDSKQNKRSGISRRDFVKKLNPRSGNKSSG